WGTRSMTGCRVAGQVPMATTRERVISVARGSDMTCVVAISAGAPRRNLDESFLVGVGGRCPESGVVVLDCFSAVDTGAEFDGSVGVESTRCQAAALFAAGIPSVDEASDMSAVVLVHSG